MKIYILDGGVNWRGSTLEEIYGNREAAENRFIQEVETAQGATSGWYEWDSLTLFELEGSPDSDKPFRRDVIRRIRREDLNREKETG